MRYFHQPPDYWLTHATLHDWLRVYSRELAESPPVDQLVAAYLGVEKPSAAHAVRDAEASEPEEWDCPFPETTE